MSPRIEESAIDWRTWVIVALSVALLWPSKRERERFNEFVNSGEFNKCVKP